MKKPHPSKLVAVISATHLRIFVDKIADKGEMENLAHNGNERWIYERIAHLCACFDTTELTILGESDYKEMLFRFMFDRDNEGKSFFILARAASVKFAISVKADELRTIYFDKILGGC